MLCNRLTDFPHHFAANAITAARPLLSDKEYRQYRSDNKAAALARHAWADLRDDCDQVNAAASGAASGGPSPSSATRDAECQTDACDLDARPDFERGPGALFELPGAPPPANLDPFADEWRPAPAAGWDYDASLFWPDPFPAVARDPPGNLEAEVHVLQACVFKTSEQLVALRQFVRQTLDELSGSLKRDLSASQGPLMSALSASLDGSSEKMAALFSERFEQRLAALEERSGEQQRQLGLVGPQPRSDLDMQSRFRHEDECRLQQPARSDEQQVRLQPQPRAGLDLLPQRADTIAYFGELFRSLDDPGAQAALATELCNTPLGPASRGLGGGPLLLLLPPPDRSCGLRPVHAHGGAQPEPQRPLPRASLAVPSSLGSCSQASSSAGAVASSFAWDDYDDSLVFLDPPIFVGVAWDVMRSEFLTRREVREVAATSTSCDELAAPWLDVAAGGPTSRPVSPSGSSCSAAPSAPPPTSGTSTPAPSGARPRPPLDQLRPAAA